MYLRKPGSLVFILGILFCVTMKAYAGAQWQAYNFEKFHFSIESPYPLTVTDHPFTPVPPGKYPMIRRMSADSFQENRAFRVTADGNEYKKYKPSLEKVEKYLSAEAQKNEEAIQVIEVNCSGVPALLVKGDNGLIHTRTLVVVKSRFFWTIKVEYAENGPGTASAMADHVIQSLTIHGVD